MRPPSARTVLVTGATGFLGLALLRALRAAPGERTVRCLVRDRERAARCGVPREWMHEGDVTMPGSLHQATADVDVVVHLAGSLKANCSSGFDAVNVAGTANLVAALRTRSPRCRLVHVSSLAAAGPSADGGSSALPPDQARPVSAYGESKRRGEVAVAQSGLAHTILRPPVVYGSGDAATRLLFRQALAPLCAVPPVARPLSAIHVDDVARALVAALGVEPGGAVLPLDGPERTDTHAFLRAIAAAAGRRARLVRVPLPLAAAAAFCSDAWCRVLGRSSYFNRDKVREIAAAGWVADGTRTRDVLGVVPAIGLREGLAAVAAAEGFVRAPRPAPVGPPN